MRTLSVSLLLLVAACSESSVAEEVAAAFPPICVPVPTPAHECAIRFDPQPVARTQFGGTGVLNRELDLSMDVPGLQVTVNVESGRGYDVELFVLDTVTGIEEQVDRVVAWSDDPWDPAVAQFDASLDDGNKVFRATCVPPELVYAEPLAIVSSVLVDTTPPDCGIASPFLDPSLGGDDGPSGMRRVPIVGWVDGDDVVGEVAEFVLDSPSGALTLEDTLVDASGRATAMGTLLGPGAVGVTLTARDHAGNLCTASREIMNDDE